MSKRRSNRGLKRKLQEAVKEQKNLEDELGQLNDAQSPNDSCKEIVSSVDNKGKDPMTMSEDEGNDFKRRQGGGFCTIL